jgi:hypothetical protein
MALAERLELAVKLAFARATSKVFIVSAALRDVIAFDDFKLRIVIVTL